MTAAALFAAEVFTAALQWDPQIRGFVIFLTAFVILPGSVFLLLATNTGVKLGALLALAGLSGWMAIMGVVWMIFGIGLKGRDPSWHVEEVISGSVATSPTEALDDFPRGDWKKLKPGDAILGDAQAAADRVLLPEDTGADHGGGGSHAAEPSFRLDKPPFEEVEDYIQVAGYRKGGENYFPGGIAETDPTAKKGGSFDIGRLTSKGFLHRPHYAVIQVSPVIEINEAEGAPPRPPVADVEKPVVTVVMVRDLGNRRFPPTLVAGSSLLVFLVVCWVLHKRDQEIMAARARAASTSPAA